MVCRPSLSLSLSLSPSLFFSLSRSSSSLLPFLILSNSQKMKELSAVVFYAVLKLTYEEMLAELEETHSQEKVMEKLDKV